MRDFTLKKYEYLISKIKAQNISIYGIKEWYESKPEEGILMRHDVDRKPWNSLKVAELESKYDIRSTFYFRVTADSFDKDIINRIMELGHEIGYHYEDLSLAGGDYTKALELFRRHLDKLRELVPVETIAMHGSPLSKYDNRSLWDRYNCRDFDLLAEAFLDIDYSDIYYFTDTGRTWGQTKANIRDKVKNGLVANVDSTDSLISFITNNPDKKIALVAHPERWEDSYILWGEQLIKDIMINAAKWIIRRFY